MSETFRPARPGEVAELARLVTHSFPVQGRTVEWWESTLRDDPRGGVEALWVGESEGRLAAACQVLPFRQWIGGAAFPTMGLAMVSISPAHRRRGMAGRLVRTAFRHSLERGDLASALYPFRVTFYERLGYGLAGEVHQYQLPPESLPDDPEERVRVSLALDGADRAAVRSLYDRWVPTQSGQMERSPGAWKALWESPLHAVALYRGPEGEPEGYATVRYRPDLPPAARFAEVEERAWLTPRAQRGIYAWLASLGDQHRQLVYRAHPDEGFGERVTEPRLPPGGPPNWGIWFPAAALLVGPMFRLLDVPGALALRTAPADAELTLTLDVTDDDLPENAGRWRLRVEGGRMHAERAPGGAAPGPTLALPVRILSRIFVGAATPSQAVGTGQAALDDARALDMLDRAFRVPRPWTFERF
ncbi:MAG TPA: GNAT family N-acetyltransferase [Longimicrobiaceae bacterium]|nr:GNAT family N-acetyltransferase [Longimicrobiaceae bacterium]